MQHKINYIAMYGIVFLYRGKIASVVQAKYRKMLMSGGLPLDCQ